MGWFDNLKARFSKFPVTYDIAGKLKNYSIEYANQIVLGSITNVTTENGEPGPNKPAVEYLFGAGAFERLKGVENRNPNFKKFYNIPTDAAFADYCEAFLEKLNTTKTRGNNLTFVITTAMMEVALDIFGKLPEEEVAERFGCDKNYLMKALKYQREKIIPRDKKKKEVEEIEKAAEKMKNNIMNMGERNIGKPGLLDNPAVVETKEKIMEIDRERMPEKKLRREYAKREINGKENEVEVRVGYKTKKRTQKSKGKTK